MPPFRLNLLGDPVLLGPDGPVSGRAAHKRRVALLAILAVARGRPVGRERLLGLLWPELPGEAARHNLSESLYVLRKELGEGALAAVGNDVALGAGVECDVAEFEAALEAGDGEAAARAYGGPLLDGFYVADAAEFERWAEGERDRLARLYARAVEKLAEAAEAEASAIRAVDWWRKLAAHDPFSSRTALRLVRALDAAGERPSALRAAEAHAVLLREELGVDPDPDFAAFVRHLRAAPPRETAPPAPLPRFPIPTPSPAAPTHGSSSKDALADGPSVDGTAGVSDDVRTGTSMDGGAATSEEETANGASVDGTPATPTDARTAGSSTEEPADSSTAGLGMISQAAMDGAARNPSFTAGQPSADVWVDATAARSSTVDRPPSTQGVKDETAERSSPADRTPSTDATGDESTGRSSSATRLSSIDGAVDDLSPSRREATSVSRARRRWRRDPRALAYEGGLAGVVLGMVLSVLAARWEDRGRPAEPRYDPRRIAVMYFEDLSPGGELQYLANGLTDGLIHELSQVSALDVVSRGGVKPYRERAVRFDSMVADLRAGSVVEGSVQRSRDSVYVTVELVDANAGDHLESRRVARPAGDVVELERAVAQEVAASLRRRLGREIRVGELRRETRSPRAADLALRAEQLREDAAALAERRDAPDAASTDALLLRADSLLAAAEREDPAWTRPTVLRGWVAHARAAAAAGSARAALLEQAAGHAARALAREPGAAAALELRGTAVAQAAAASPNGSADARLAAAEADLRAAVAAEPGRATAWSRLSILLRMRGKFAESDLAARRALAEDAYLDDAAAIRQRLVFGAMSAGDYPQARAECARGRAQFPADWRFVECALTLLRQDPARPADPAAAWRMVAELDRLDPPERARAEGRAYSPLYRRMVAAAVTARAGGADSARAVLARARAQADTSADLRASLDYDEAYLRVVLDERQAARALLDRVLAARPWLRAYLARDPLFRGVIPATPAPSASPPAPPG